MKWYIGSIWIVKSMFPGSGFWNKVREMVYRLALEIITATKPLSTRAIFKVLFQILTSCVGNHYYNILYVYWIKHIFFINVWFQNNHRQLNISACISNSAYSIPHMRRVRKVSGTFDIIPYLWWSWTDAVINRSTRPPLLHLHLYTIWRLCWKWSMSPP